ncbi:MAG TPA: RusA family crossover junction endodeoxyribonuclease [Micromonosporaceae bacterium]|nr:RusA family crossover junction endodeoxyribonuclease [Micromonosporaceae bacterium]
MPALFDVDTPPPPPAPEPVARQRPKPVLALEIIVRGDPAPQGSKKGFYNAKLGRVLLVEDSKKVKPWREDVCAAGIEARAGAPTLDCALLLEMVFTTMRPKSHYRTGRNSHLVRDDAPIQPTAKPDLSKLTRSTEDALTTAGVFRDDALIVEYLRLAKVYAGEDPDALDSPGAVIRIYTLGAQP